MAAVNTSRALETSVRSGGCTTAAILEMVFTVIQRQLILPRHLHAADCVIRMTPARPCLAIMGSNSKTSYTRTAAFIADFCWGNLLL